VANTFDTFDAYRLESLKVWTLPLVLLTISKPFARESGKKWTATPPSSASAKTSAFTAARSKSPTCFIDRFGPERVIDTPIAESAIVGAAFGASLTGMRPVAEFQFMDLAQSGSKTENVRRKP